jgi:hypothetical protein
MYNTRSMVITAIGQIAEMASFLLQLQFIHTVP